MIILIVGLALFLGIHSVRIVADGWRARFIAARGQMTWKGLYYVIAVAGFVLICVGFGQARRQPVVLWSPPSWTHHVTASLTLLAFLLITAAYVPANGIKSRVEEPMILGVKCWALGHLLANGALADVVLFGSFLVWSVLDFRAAKQRRRAGMAPAIAAPRAARTAATLIAGVLAWTLFAFHLHLLLIGVRPLV